MFSSLAIPNYRNWFIGATVSNIGQWMARTAQSWLVLVILTDNSSSALGALTAFMFLPGLVLGPFGGSLADRFPKRRILMFTQTVGAIDSLTLGTLVITGHAQLWMVFMIAFVDGVVTSIDNPARQAMVSEIVPPQCLPNAIGLNSTSFNTARLLGPGVAGVLIALIGTGQVIVLNTLSFISMMIALRTLRSERMHPVSARKGSGGVIEGLKYLRTRPDLLVVLACGLAQGGLGFNFQISNAVMSTNLFGKGASEFGALGSIMGIGSLTAALLAARRAAPRLRFVLGGMAGYTVLSLWAAFSPNYATFAFLQAPIGLFTITALVTGNTLVQMHSSPAMRGRMLGLWNLTIMGVAPIVSPLVGWLGDSVGPRSTVLFGVVAVAVATALITWIIMHNDRLRFRLRMRRFFPTLRLEHLPERDVDGR